MFKTIGKDLVKAFNTGVSYFLPAVVIGGVFLAFALATGEAGSDGMKITNSFMQNINTIGSAGMAMMIPMLAGYIAYSLAGKPALAPGMIIGYIANNPAGDNNVSTGFLGAMIMGILVGYVCKWIKSWKVGPTIKSIMPVLIILIISALICALAYLYILVGPLGALMKALTEMLSGMQGGSAILLGIVIGLMTAFDMGGPINKTASAFTMALMAEGLYGPNGAFRVAVAIPPLGLALSTFISRRKYDNAEKQLGVTSAFMGLIGITEGAIPFAVKDIKHVLPAIMGGSAVGAGLAMMHAIECYVPHGGMIVAAATNKPLLYTLDMAIGVIVTALLLMILKPNLEDKEKKKVGTAADQGSMPVK